MPALDIDCYLVSASRRAHRLREGRVYLMGREQGADIVVQDALASRRHAELRWDDQYGWVLVDLGSRNGVVVNGRKVTGQVGLGDDDQIQIGGQVFSFQMLPAGSDIGSVSNTAPQISNQVTLGPEVNMAELATQGSAFSGAIQSQGLLELLQFMVQTRKTGRMDLIGATGLLGSVWVGDGSILHAASGIVVAFEALVDLVRQPLNRFAFHTDDQGPGQVTIGGGADGVLMELARCMDERRR